jgi:hypothetical protein
MKHGAARLAAGLPLRTVTNGMSWFQTTEAQSIIAKKLTRSLTADHLKAPQLSSLCSPSHLKQNGRGADFDEGCDEDCCLEETELEETGLEDTGVRGQQNVRWFSEPLLSVLWLYYPLYGHWPRSVCCLGVRLVSFRLTDWCCHTGSYCYPTPKRNYFLLSKEAFLSLDLATRTGCSGCLNRTVAVTDV